MARGGSEPPSPARASTAPSTRRRSTGDSSRVLTAMTDPSKEIIERYDPERQKDQVIEAEHLARYRWAAQFAHGRRVLDVACGTAYGCSLLAAAGAASVTGVDIDAATIENARPRVSGAVSLEVGDIRELAFDADTFDLVVCFETIEHTPDPEVAIDEMRRVLTPQGLLLISSPNRGVLPDVNPFHIHEYTAQELHDSLAQRFTHVALRRQRTWVASGVLEDRAFASGDDALIADVDVRKLSSDAPGHELYTVAAASDVELPGDRGLVNLTSDVELTEWYRVWHEQDALLRSQKDVLEQQAPLMEEHATILAGQAELLHQQEEALTAYAVERDELRTALLAAEREASGLVQLESDFEELGAALQEEGNRHERAAAHAADLEQELVEVRKELAQLAEQEQQARDELKAAWDAYGVAMNSLSWRLTAPVRAVGKLGRQAR